MSDTPTLYQIRRHVAIAMARTVIEKSGFSQSTYHEGIVPSKDPMDGFGSSIPFWAYILGVVEGRLENTNPLYAVFDVTENFAKSSRKAAIRVTNNKIALHIHGKLSAAGESQDEQ